MLLDILIFSYKITNIQNKDFPKIKKPEQLPLSLRSAETKKKLLFISFVSELIL